MGQGFRKITKEDAENRLLSFVVSKGDSFIESMEKLFGCDDQCITDNLKRMEIFDLYERVRIQYSARNIYKALSDLDRELPTDDNGRIDPARVKQLEARLKGHMLVAERVARDTWGTNTKVEHSGGMTITGTRNIDLIPEDDE